MVGPMQEPVDYLDPRLPAGLARVLMPVVEATPSSLEGYGHLVDDPRECRIEIVRWPAAGSRPVDIGTGDQGGTTEGMFESEWRGDVLLRRLVVPPAIQSWSLTSLQQRLQERWPPHSARPILRAAAGRELLDIHALSANPRAYRAIRVAPDQSWGYRTRPTGMSGKERRGGGVFGRRGRSYQTATGRTEPTVHRNDCR